MECRISGRASGERTIYTCRVRFEPSLGRMDYKRVVRYTLIEDGDYNDACKIYRDYVREQGNLCTLNEKAARVDSVDDLIGCSFIHKGIKTFVQPESDFLIRRIQIRTTT